MTFYKATRPDGTDFYTGTIDYAAAVGRELAIAHTGFDRTQGASGYLSVATITTACTGMRWPCRLFEVAPIGRAYETDLSHKRAVRGVLVVRELDAHEVFGPQGQAVVAIIDRASTVTVAQARQLAAARDAAWDAAWAAAWDAARDAAWAAAWDAARDAAWDAARDAAGDAARTAARAAAGELVRDLITPEQYELLVGPWYDVMGGRP